MMAVSPAADGYVAGQAYHALSATIVGPLFLTFLLLFVSGLPASEKPKSRKRFQRGDNWEAYARYLNRTSILIPFPPRLYERLPRWVKRTVLLEFPMYVFDPSRDEHSGQPGSTEGDGHAQSGAA